MNTFYRVEIEIETDGDFIVFDDTSIYQQDEYSFIGMNLKRNFVSEIDANKCIFDICNDIISGMNNNCHKSSGVQMTMKEMQFLLCEFITNATKTENFKEEKYCGNYYITLKKSKEILQ